jgi:hypothetical protein
MPAETVPAALKGCDIALLVSVLAHKRTRQAASSPSRLESVAVLALLGRTAPQQVRNLGCRQGGVSGP